MRVKERLAKLFFSDVIKGEVQKSSKQVVSHVLGLSPQEGVYPDIDFDIFNEMYEQTSWVRAVVGVICKAVTARGYTIVPAKPNPDPHNAELLAEFFANCNPNDTLLEILDDVTRDEYVFGNSFVEVVYGADGKPKELWNLDATSIRVKADDHGTILGYVQSPRYSRAEQVEFETKEVIHFKLGTRGSTLYGLSPLASLILPVTVDKFAQIYNRAFFVNGAKIKGAFIMKDASSEQVERNREYLDARSKNPELAHADLVMEGSVEFKQIGVNQKDMEFLELREFTRNEILAVYGVPPSKVSIIETGNIGSGTGEHQTQTFYEETILPFQMRVAEKITKLIVRSGFGITDWAFQFNKRAIDEKDQAEIFDIYLKNGVFTPDDVRRIVAPRLPELQKDIASETSAPIAKGKLSPGQTIRDATQAAVDIENRFVRALQDLFRRFKSRLSEKIRFIAREQVAPKIEKQLGDLEAILELIDQDDIARVVTRYSLEAATKAAQLAARRNDLKDINDVTPQLKEFFRNNAVGVAARLSESIQSSIRQSLLEGLEANESIQELQRRIERQIDSFASINIGAATDAEGNVIREAHTRNISRTAASETIARTEANRAFNEGNLDALDQAGVASVKFLLASDACEECRAVSESLAGEKLGKSMSIDDARNTLPVHPNCRCTWVAE